MRHYPVFVTLDILEPNYKSLVSFYEVVLWRLDMELRHHPLMSYRGVPNWPPIWIWRNGERDKQPPKGEVGVLREVFESRVQPSLRIFLIVEYESEEYMGCLLFGDLTFCNQVYALLTQHCGHRIQDIGSLFAGHLL